MKPRLQAKALKRLAYLQGILEPERLIEIVDVGANPITVPDYQPLMAAKLARVTGFDPQESAFAELKDRQNAYERNLPYAIGDGTEGELKVSRSGGLTSLLEPDLRTFEYLQRWSRAIKIIERVPLKTHRLDDLEDINQLDFLKIDIQGGELSVFRNGVNKLSGAVAVMTEVAFIPLYVGQPLMDAQMVELRAQGFMLHRFVFTKQVQLGSSFEQPGAKRRKGSQLVDGDAIFIRDLRNPDAWDDAALTHLALLADGCFQSPDLALRCLTLLLARGRLSKPQVRHYAEMVYPPAKPGAPVVTPDA